MAIRLARNIKAEEKPKNGFDVIGTEGKDYNLDEIEKLKDRKAADTELVIRNIENDKDLIHSVGDVSITKKCDDLNISSIDYKKYLLSKDKSTTGYTPEISLRRPIIIWEDGQEDTRSEDEISSLYNDFEKLRKELLELRANIKISNVISSDRRDYIPTVGAVIDYHSMNQPGSGEDCTITIVPPSMMLGKSFSIKNKTLNLLDKFSIDTTEKTLVLGG